MSPAKPTPPDRSRGELALLRRLRTLLNQGGEEHRALDVNDDMCLITQDFPTLLWSVDMLMDGTDFDSGQHGWEQIGRKALAVNLSDCAAMAARPVAALCAVALQDSLSMDDAEALIAGAHACGRQFGCPVVGGDTNSWPQPTAISVSVAAVCELPSGPVRRNGAQVGDRVWLSGPVGGSILGRHLTFEPRVQLAQQVADRLRPHAMIDVSDGLALDLWRILDASGVGAVLDPAALDQATHADALRLATQDGRPAREHALYDGEDFELLIVVPAQTADEDCRAFGLFPLGTIIAGGDLSFGLPDGRREPIPIRGWEHFQ